MSIQAQNTELNIVPGGIIPVVHVSQYDVDRVLTFNLYDRNSEASLASGTTAVIEGTKPDGNGFQYAATITGNTVTVNTTIQMTVLSGTVDCKIVLRNGSQVIGTALFIMDVEKAGINENTPISETDLPLIISEATEQMQRAEAAATAAALSEENAEAEALKAEGYATGKQNGGEVSSESPYYHNNAEYYSEYAESIADRLPEGLSPKGTCVFADLPSISESIVGDMWVISDSFITTSDFRGGSGVSVQAGAYVYLTDSNKWDILPSKSSGHMIVDSEGVTMPQRAKLKFVGCTVTDDSTNDTTIIEAEGGGSSVVASLAITTNNSAFYGQTVTVKDSNGDTVNTGVFSNSGTVSIGVVGANYYTAIVTTYGATVSQQVAVTESGSYNVALNSDTILGAWINKGGLDYTDYADFSEVEADEEAVRRLMTIHASVDYLAECGSATDSLVLSIINSDICAKWINLRDYALDTLYANTYLKAMMDTADKYFYGEWVITDNTTTPPTWGAKGNVPVMTADDAPYGVASASSVQTPSNLAYKPFDGHPSNTGSSSYSTAHWQSNNVSPATLSYKFVNPVNIKRVKLQIYWNYGGLCAKKYEILASNTPDSWDVVLYTADNLSNAFRGDETIDLPNNDNYYLYYGVRITGSYNQNYVAIDTLQFYGRELKESVPAMTSNTAPYGVASASSEYNSDYSAWKAFNSSEAFGFLPSQSENQYLAYTFTSKIKPVFCVITRIGSGTQVNNFVVKGYDNASSKDAISDTIAVTTGETKFALLNATRDYKTLELSCSDWGRQGNGVKLQFYGLNYSEYDWDTEHPRHYLYDHGVEFEEFDNDIPCFSDSRYSVTNAIKKPYELLIDTTQLGQTTWKCSSFITSNTTDYTPYSALFVRLGLDSIGYNIVMSTAKTEFGYYGAGNAVGGISEGINSETVAGNIEPQLKYIDTSNVNTNIYTAFPVYVGGTSTRNINNKQSIEEAWLE